MLTFINCSDSYFWTYVQCTDCRLRNYKFIVSISLSSISYQLSAQCTVCTLTLLRRGYCPWVHGFIILTNSTPLWMTYHNQLSPSMEKIPNWLIVGGRDFIKMSTNWTALLHYIYISIYIGKHEICFLQTWVANQNCWFEAEAKWLKGTQIWAVEKLNHKVLGQDTKFLCPIFTLIFLPFFQPCPIHLVSMFCGNVSLSGTLTIRVQKAPVQQIITAAKLSIFWDMWLFLNPLITTVPTQRSLATYQQMLPGQWYIRLVWN